MCVCVCVCCYHIVLSLKTTSFVYLLLMQMHQSKSSLSPTVRVINRGSILAIPNPKVAWRRETSQGHSMVLSKIGCERMTQQIVQHQVNRRASESHQNTVSYECYFGLSKVSKAEKIIVALARSIRTEVGLHFLEGALLYLKKTLYCISVIRQIWSIQQGVALYEVKEQLDAMEEKKECDINTKQSELLSKIFDEVRGDGNELSSRNEHGGADITKEFSCDSGQEI